MSVAPSKPKKEYRKRRLFPRTLQEVVQDATKPLMSKQGKLYGALLRDWVSIVGEPRAAISKPQRLQFLNDAAGSAILHLKVRPAAAPELAYAMEQMLEQCARYFGYRAITRIVIHTVHGEFEDAPRTQAAPSAPIKPIAMSEDIPSEMRDVFARLAAHVASASDNKK